MSKKLSYKNALRRATYILRNRELSMNLIKSASENITSRAKLSKNFKAAREAISAYIRLFKAYVTGSYRDISWKNMIYVTAILIYFVTPTDLVPDFIPINGLLDDATLALWLYKHLANELESFLIWEKNKNEPLIDDN